MRRSKPKAPTLGKKLKGFPIKLTPQHFMTIHQLYPWLREQGLTDARTDAALSVIPERKFSAEELAEGLKVGALPDTDFKDGFFLSKTVRVRAEFLEGMIQLLRCCAACSRSGNLGPTFWRRAEDLSEISVLDQLCDAQGGE